MSRQDKRSLQTVSFFDGGVDFEGMNNRVVTQTAQQQLRVSQIPEEQAARSYNKEERDMEISDISTLMLHRLEAGYKLGSYKLNAALCNRFKGYHRQYSSRNERTRHLQGVKVFWQWLSKIEKEEFEPFKNGILHYLYGDEDSQKNENAFQ